MPIVNFHHHGRDTAALEKAVGPDWLYVGRGNPKLGLPHSPLANPYSHKKEANAQYSTDPLKDYEVWLRKKFDDKDPAILDALSKITSSTHLVCWCDPKPCHARIVEDFAARYWLELADWWEANRGKITSQKFGLNSAPPARKKRKPQIKGLTLHTPWSAAVIAGDKDVENRSWKPYDNQLQIGDYLAIHSGKTHDEAANAFIQRLGGTPFTADQCHPGHIIGVVRYEGVTTDINHSPWYVGQGQIGWMLADPVPLRHPIPAKGRQGIWPLDKDLYTAVRQAYAQAIGQKQTIQE